MLERVGRERAWEETGVHSAHVQTVRSVLRWSRDWTHTAREMARHPTRAQVQLVGDGGA